MGQLWPSRSLVAVVVLFMYFLSLASSFTPRIVNDLREQDIRGAGATPGLRLSVSRRPTSYPSISEAENPLESLQWLAQKDLYRVKEFSRRILAEPSSRSNFRAEFPDITHPGGRKQQLKDEAVVENSTSGLYQFQTTVESGVPFNSGEYFMDLYIGTPPRHISVIVDTGSDLTWVQCEPCVGCYHQEGPKFQPNVSSSYEALTCDSENCISAGGYGEDPKSCDKMSKNLGVCKYFYNYGDYSNTTGEYALETVTFQVSSGAPIQIDHILFGCGHSNVGLFQGSGGLLGLGQGPISFVSQVGNLFGDKFSYCLVNRDDPNYVKSMLVFGEDEAYKRLEGVHQWTPFLVNTPVNTFYYVNITGVRVAGEMLEIPESVWQFDSEGYGGTIIDSGTTLSYFRQEAFDAVKKAFADRISYPVVTSVPILSLCYNITGIERPDFPSMSIVFQANAVMELPFNNYFIRPNPKEDVYCLALLGMQPKGLNILGNFQQQNFHVVYDRGNKRLGFAPVDCTGLL